jgi:hypothetical protein
MNENGFSQFLCLIGYIAKVIHSPFCEHKLDKKTRYFFKDLVGIVM